MTRILWIGCHKLLVKTELAALRDMGYEVYRPTYLSEIYDQSAVYEVDSNPSTLPTDVLEVLGKTNFFYDSISTKVSKIINQYFDVCIVTISPTWLMHAADAFEGKLIFRTFGQPYALTTEFETLGLASKLLNRGNFFFLPHSLQSLESEHSWLKVNAIEVPYWLEDDVFELENSWDNCRVNLEVGLLCPNVKNPYYLDHYRYLRKYFKSHYFSIFGVQPESVNDRRVIGTLARQDLLARFQNLSGFLYTYKEKNTCYLPPIEAAIIGVPVLYPKGSLLSKYLGIGGPGEWIDEREASKLTERLLHGDLDLIREIQAYQAPLKDLYRKSVCISKFNEVFTKIIENQIVEEIRPSKIVVIPFYFPGSLVQFDGNLYSSAQGIPRVVKFYAQTLIANGYGVDILVKKDQMADSWGYFNNDNSASKCRIIPINREKRLPLFYEKAFKLLKNHAKKLPNLMYSIIRNTYHSRPKGRTFRPDKLLIEKVIEQGGQNILFIPHYYHFRDLIILESKQKILLYLPDYVPYLYPREFAKEIKYYEKPGRKLVRKASLILTNSLATANYLPLTNLGVETRKVRIAKLPRLGTCIGFKQVEHLVDELFLFYPTQFRPNKRIDLLLQAFDKVAFDYDISLVLTGNIEHIPVAKSVYNRMFNKNLVKFIGSVSDEEMNWLYQNCEGVVISTASEGNFPPQLIEAISFEKPFVAPRIAVVTEELGEDTPASLFESNSVEALECMIRNMLTNKEIEIQKVKNLKVNLMNERDEEAGRAFISVVSELFT